MFELFCLLVVVCSWSGWLVGSFGWMKILVGFVVLLVVTKRRMAFGDVGLVVESVVFCGVFMVALLEFGCKRRRILFPKLVNFVLALVSPNLLILASLGVELRSGEVVGVRIFLVPISIQLFWRGCVGNISRKLFLDGVFNFVDTG